MAKLDPDKFRRLSARDLAQEALSAGAHEDGPSQGSELRQVPEDGQIVL